MIVFLCPLCGRRNETPDEYAGQIGPCAACGRQIEIPTTSSAGPVSPFAPAGMSSMSGGISPVVLAAGRRRYWGRIIAGGLGILAVVVLCGGGLTAALMPMLRDARAEQWQKACSNNLKRVAQGLRKYEQVYGVLPPAYVADEEGRPMHSWRVLVLPYVGQEQLYAEYRFDEPWYGPHNVLLADRMPAVYQCPGEPTPEPNEPSYLMTVGRGRISDGASAARLSEIRDGAENTVVLVEVANAGINWLEPVDLEDLALIDSYHGEMANIAFASGETMRWPLSINVEGFEKMTTIAADDGLPLGGGFQPE